MMHFHSLGPLRRSWYAVLTTLLMLWAYGCGEGTAPEAAPIVYLSSMETDTFKPIVIVDPGAFDNPKATPQGSLKEKKQYKDLFAGVERNPQALFARPGVDAQLPLIERAYSGSGRFHDLTAMYAADVQRRGAQSLVAPRLAWAYIKLGQEQRASKLIDSLLKARPNDPIPWFLFGAMALRQAADSNDSARDVVLGWSKTVKLAPNFIGYDRLDAATLRREVQKQRTKLTRLTQRDLDERERALVGEVTKVNAPAPPTQPLAPTAPVVNPSPSPTIAPAAPVVKPAAVAVKAPTAMPLNVMVMKALVAQDPQEARDHLQAMLKTWAKPGLLQTVKQAPSTQSPEWMTTFELMWKHELGRDHVSPAFRAFASRQDLPTSVLVRAARFSAKQLQDAPLTSKLTAQIKAKDPALFKRLSLDKLTAQLN